MRKTMMIKKNGNKWNPKLWSKLYSSKPHLVKQFLKKFFVKFTKMLI